MKTSKLKDKEKKCEENLFFQGFYKSYWKQLGHIHNQIIANLNPNSMNNSLSHL